MQKIVSISTADIQWLMTNYGGFFQHYALREVLKRMGFRPYRMDATGPLGVFIAIGRRLVRNVAWNLMCLVSSRRLFRRSSVVGYLRHWMRFRHDYVRMIGPVRETQADESRCAAIVGGGQAWSLFCQDRPDLYWEDSNKDIRRVSYSVSSAWKAFAENREWINRIRRAGLKADFLSFRERAGVELFNKVVPEKISATTLDPVFLLSREDYLTLIPGNSVFKRKTMWCYMLGREIREKEAHKLQMVASALGADLRITAIQGAEWRLPVKYGIDPSPVGFLQCMRDCDYFVTNSFHGLAFAIIFKKNFLYVRQQDWTNAGNNLRQEEILQLFGLTSRISCFCDDMGRCVEVLKQGPILENREAELRTASLKWLSRALEGLK